MFNAKNLMLDIGGAKIPCAVFGKGKKNLIMLPGLGDGLTTVKGKALPMALMYRDFMKDFTVYMMSRREPLPEGFSTKDMAEDIALFMDKLGIEKASIFGVSMGGMIAQHFAADYPQLLEKLVLVVTCACPNPILLESLEEWTDCARRNDHTALMESNIRRIYSDRYLQKNRGIIPIIGKLTKPESYDRFFIQAEACRSHDAFDRLGSVTAPTLVIGGEQDHSLGGAASREIAGQIPGAELRMYPQWGHGLYEEAKDFNQKVLDFLME